MQFACLGAALAVAAFAVAAPASAEIYGALGAGAQVMKFDTAPAFDDARFATVGGRVGWKANRWLGVEGDLFLGLNEERVFERPPIDVKLDAGAFVYGVGFLPLGDKVDLIGRAGWGHVVGRIKGLGLSDDTKDGAFTYGLGAQYKFSPVHAVRLDATRYEVKDLPMTGVAAAYVRTF